MSAFGLKDKVVSEPRAAELAVQIAITRDEASEILYVVTDQGRIFRQELPHGSDPRGWVEIALPGSPAQKK